MKTFFFLLCVILGFAASHLPDTERALNIKTPNASLEETFRSQPSEKLERGVITTAKTEIGEELGRHRFLIQKTDRFLRLAFSHYTHSRSSRPAALSNLFQNIVITEDLLRFPLTVGRNWEQIGLHGLLAQIRVEGCESVEIALGTFPNCLMHKTFLKDAEGAELESGVMNGTRYLWFAKGVGLVKMRYEHANGIITEAELTALNVPSESDDYFPMNSGNTWTYKWQNNYFDETFVADVQIEEMDEELYLTAESTTANGKELGDTKILITKTDTLLTLQERGSSSQGYLNPRQNSPIDRRVLFHNVASLNLFPYPLTAGKTWAQTGAWWGSQARVTIEPSEEVTVSAGTFSMCLKHKTVITDASAPAQSEGVTAVINGTRYLWFAKGVGLVKMRYEHADGSLTEAELTTYRVSEESEAYFPLNIGTRWTYTWHNATHAKYKTIEEIQVTEAGRGNETRLKEAFYDVAITVDNPNLADTTAHVTLALTPEEPDNPVRLRLNHDPRRGSDYIDNEITANYADGSPCNLSSYARFYRTWELHKENWRNLPFPITLNYRGKTSWFQQNSMIDPYFREDCIFWPSTELFIFGESSDKIEVNFTLPKGWRVSTSWQRVGTKGHRFLVKNREELLNAALLVGKHAEVLATSQGADNTTEVLLAIGGDLKKSKRQLQHIVEDFLTAYVDIFRGGPNQRVLFVINPFQMKFPHEKYLLKMLDDHGVERIVGQKMGQDISILMDSTYLKRANQHEWAPLIGHEVFHIWDGLTVLMPFTRQDNWFREGVTTYYSLVVAARLGYVSEKQLLERLQRACKTYLTMPNRFTISDDYSGRLGGYEGGCLIAAALDVQLRKRHQNTRSLDDVMRLMYQQFGNTEEKYTLYDIIRVVSHVAGEDFESFFQKYVFGKERLPLAEYFGDAGLDVEIVLSEELPTVYYICQQLGFFGLYATDDGLGFYDRPREVISPEEHDGKDESQPYYDKLIAINGTPVQTLEEVRQLAKTWTSGDALRLTVQRVGANVAEEIVLLGELPENPPTSNDTDVKITKSRNRTDLQRAILSGILGKSQRF